MNSMKFKLAAGVLSLSMALSVAPAFAAGKVKSVKVTNLPATYLTVKKNGSKTLKVSVKTSGGASKKVAYKTSNKKVVKVNSKGKVTGVKKGTAKVTVYAKASKSKKAVITVTVGTPATSVKLNKTKASLKTGKTLKLKATVKPSSASNKKVVWTTSNKKVAAVESNGTVHAWKKGTVKITATAKDGSGKKATCTIKTSGKAVDTADQLI